MASEEESSERHLKGRVGSLASAEKKEVSKEMNVADPRSELSSTRIGGERKEKEEEEIGERIGEGWRGSWRQRLDALPADQMTLTRPTPLLHP